MFARFAREVAFDHMVLLDLLMSNETRFLEYMVAYCRELGGPALPILTPMPSESAKIGLADDGRPAPA